MTRIIAHHYPNNELRVVICPDVPMGKSQGHEDCQVDDCMDAGPDSTLVIRSELKTAGEVGEAREVPVGPRPGYGGSPRPTGFGNNARRTILRCAGALEKFGAEPEEVAFLTGTLPGSTNAAMRALQDWSSYAVNLLKAKISKLGIHDSLSFYVWELQARGALHIHYAVHVPVKKDMDSLISEFKRIWIQVIDAICERSGVDLWEREDGGTWRHQKDIIRADAQVCRKSPGAYMAKYVSKEAFAPKYINSKNSEFLGPVRWWGCSRPLLKLMKSMTISTEKIGISWHRIKHIREDLLSILDGLNARIVRYTDRAKSAEVLVSYDQQNGMAVFNSIARFLAGPLLGLRREKSGDEFSDSYGDHPVQTGASAITVAALAVANEEICRKCINPRGSHGARVCRGNGAPGLSYQMAIW